MGCPHMLIEGCGCLCFAHLAGVFEAVVAAVVALEDWFVGFVG